MGNPSPQSMSRVAEEESQNPNAAWFRASSRFRSPMVQLHKEMLHFSDFISPTSEEQASRDAVVQRVSEVIKYIWPHCSVKVFGSFGTGLYLPTSDIDVVILNSKVKLHKWASLLLLGQYPKEVLLKRYRVDLPLLTLSWMMS